MCSVFEAELADHIPVVKTSIQGTRLVGRMCVGKTSFRSSLRRLAFVLHLHIKPWKPCDRQQERASIAELDHRPG